MLGTWGLRSINITTFNQRCKDTSRLTYPKELRDVIFTGLKVRNLIFNILGYIPGVSVVSGTIRAGIGVAMLVGVLAVGDRDAHDGKIIGRWYDEALNQSMAQIVRGLFEAFVPYGFAANALLDIVGTVVNLGQEIFWEGFNDLPYSRTPSAHDNPTYPLPFKTLYLI